MSMGNIPVTTTTKIFPKVLRCEWEACCNTAIQMGGVLTVFPFSRAYGPRKYCNTNWKRTATKIAGVLRYSFRVFLNLGFAKPMFCNSVLFTKTTGITKMAKMTKTTQTAKSKGADCWICGNHGKHGNDENHENPGCKT